MDGKLVAATAILGFFHSPDAAPASAASLGAQIVDDFATVLKNSAGAPVPATDQNHALFVQDAWTVGHGLTLNLGVRIEKESLPAPPGIGIARIRTINFQLERQDCSSFGSCMGIARR